MVKVVEAHVGFTKGGEVHMVVDGLPCDPCDIDSEDIELVRTSKRGGGVRKFDKRVLNTSSDESGPTNDKHEGGLDKVVRRLRDKGGIDLDNPRPGPSRERGARSDGSHEGGREKAKKFKLKVITVGKDKLGGSKMKAGRFVREGEFSDKFRLPYTKREEQALVNFFLENGGYKLRKGKRIWEQMENSGICPGRTWQSMKQRWEKYISKTLDKFGVTLEELEERDVQEGSETGEDDETDGHLDLRGFRSKANYYSNADDVKIIEFIIKNKRFHEVGGNALWDTMEKRGDLPGRSWHSLKERFRKVIIKKIGSYDLSFLLRVELKD